MITGGDISGKSVEIWSPNIHCIIPEFEVSRHAHTQEGLLACGEVACGEFLCERGTCDEFQQGKWVQTYTTTSRRSYHASWKTENGIYLIGGSGSPESETTDLLKDDGQVVQGFNLQDFEYR